MREVQLCEFLYSCVVKQGIRGLSSSEALTLLTPRFMLGRIWQPFRVGVLCLLCNCLFRTTDSINCFVHAPFLIEIRFLDVESHVKPCVLIQVPRPRSQCQKGQKTRRSLARWTTYVRPSDRQAVSGHRPQLCSS